MSSNLFLLVVGCFMETVVAILIITPMLMPVIIIVLNLMIGLLTPPFGTVLFVMVGVSGLSFERVVRAKLPFTIRLLAVLLLTMVFLPSSPGCPISSFGNRNESDCTGYGFTGMVFLW